MPLGTYPRVPDPAYYLFFVLLLGLAPGLANVGVEVTRGVAPMPLLDLFYCFCELQELSWLLEAEQQETRRLQ